ncbi:MAG: urease accessory protein UreD [Sandaracinus sp.]|nr:urease accessory protein UreD [Sandaracinus sp.]
MGPPPSTMVDVPVSGWRAELRVRLGPRGDRTEVRDSRHRGPLRIQRAFHPEPDGTAHLVVLHPPAGLVSGDALFVELEVEPEARALFTTTGAGKAYRSSGTEASTVTRLRVGAGADAEHVPQETVIFDGARARLETHVELAAGARFCGWEVVCLGRPACDERFTRGRLRLAFEIAREGKPWLIERGALEGGETSLDAPWGMSGHAAFGTLVATDVSVEALRVALEDLALPIAVTEVDGLSVVRVLGRDGAEARAALERARHVVRDAWGRPRVDPAIWRS